MKKDMEDDHKRRSKIFKNARIHAAKKLAKKKAAIAVK